MLEGRMRRLSRNRILEICALGREQELEEIRIGEREIDVAKTGRDQLCAVVFGDCD